MAMKEKVNKAVDLINLLNDAQLDELINILEAKKEEGVFGQELSADELDAAAGGEDCPGAIIVPIIARDDEEEGGCIESEKRDIYGGSGFANCAATVEEGSRCGTNDACSLAAVRYTGMDCSMFDCTKAWR